MSELVLFETGEVKFALDRKCIGHIGSMRAGACEAKGRVQRQTIAYKGKPLVVFDLAAYLDRQSTAPHSPDTRLIVVKGPPAMALWADNIRGILAADAGQTAELPPVFTGAARACFPKVLRLKNQLALVVDTAALAALEQCDSASASTPQIEMKPSADKRDVFLAPEEAQPNPLTGRSEVDTLETVVAEKLQQIIGRRVKQVVARAMAETLDQHRIKYNYG